MHYSIQIIFMTSFFRDNLRIFSGYFYYTKNIPQKTKCNIYNHMYCIEPINSCKLKSTLKIKNGDSAVDKLI